eukprot:TRINITY_DN5058_c0_g1_i5.p2 TRINITY_DN5058_c0_g1~~TRINITY_DN5058_c0_g1_i5.p2  ORF type:complete len:352 (+),score=56.99 TRINITY_DN5058_c0_g1_i5:1822-2877(+)
MKTLRNSDTDDEPAPKKQKLQEIKLSNYNRTVKEESDFQSQKPPDFLRTDSVNEEARTCSICYEPWFVNGEHRIVSLKCGHMYGKKCILKWLKQTKQCPQCKEAAKPSDIIPLWTGNIVAIDGAEKEKLQEDLRKEKIQRMKVETEKEQLRLQYKMLEKNYSDLNQKHENLLKSYKQLQSLSIAQQSQLQASLSTTSSSDLLVSSLNTEKPRPTSLSNIIKDCDKIRKLVRKYQNGRPNPKSYKLEEHAVVPVVGSRFIEYLQFPSILLASYQNNSSNSTSNTSPVQYGVKKISANDPNHTSIILLHSNSLKDIKGCPHESQPNYFLTSSMDKSIKINQCGHVTGIHRTKT